MRKIRPPDPAKVHYLYRYIDPRTSVVRYVGIGTYKSGSRNRCYDHWNAVKNGGDCQNRHLSALLKQLKTVGLQPRIEIIQWLSVHVEAKQAEIATIALHGRKEDGGTLCNFTKGGDGTVGFMRPHTEAEKALIGAHTKAHWKNPEYAARRAASQRKYVEENADEIAARAARVSAAWTPEMKAAHGAAISARPQEYRDKISASLLANDEFRKKSSVHASTALQTPENIAKRKVTLKQTMAVEEFRVGLRERAKESANRPERKAKTSAQMRERWKNDAAYIEKMKARPKPDEAARKAQGAKTSAAIANFSEETKQKLSEFRRQAAKARWQNPEFKAKVAASQAAQIAAKRAAQLSNQGV